MFHWICPECGQEIPPAVKECPACDPSAAAAAEVLAAPAEVKAAPVEASQQQQEVTKPVDLPAKEAVHSEPDQPAPDPLPAPLLLAAGELRDAPKEPSVEEAPPAPPQPAIQLERPVAAFALPPSLKAALEAYASPKAKPPQLPGAKEVPPEPLMAQALPATPPRAAAPVVAAPGLASPLEQTEVPAPAKPASAPSGPAPTLAPPQLDVPSARRSIRPAAPPKQILMPDSGPRITLPGPALPSQLNSLQEAGISQILTERPGGNHKHAGSPKLLVSLVITSGVLASCLVAVFYGIPRMQADSKPAAPPPTEPTPTATASYSLARSVEVSGFRFITGSAKTPEVEYLVVNHSPSELSNVTIYVTLRTDADKPGQPPLCRFSFRSPGLAPFEAKEMTSPIEKLPRSTVLPDWQNLRADVDITP